MDNIKLFTKNEKELETLSQEMGMEFGREKCAMLVMKIGKGHITDGMKLSNQDKIRTLGEKETYKYLGILEAQTIEQVEIFEKLRKNISGEQESCSRQNYQAENLSNKYITRYLFEVDQRRD